MMIIIFLMALGGIALQVGLALPDLIRNYLRHRANEKILRKIRPVEVNEDAMCQGKPHTWISAPHTVDDNGEFTHVNVCKNCGLIPAMGLMATKEGLEHIEGHKRHLAAEEKLKDDFIRQEEEGMRKHFEEELKGGLDFHKIEQVYLAGQSI